MNGNTPLKVHVTRGPMNESEHIVDAVVMNADKKILASYGDYQKAIYPRSAIKMLQALLLIESGAYDAQKLDARHLAIACSSHYADPVHTQLVHEWLAKFNLSEDNLRCGIQPPTRESVRDLLILAHQKPNRGHNNCSGKHCGIISTCLHKGYDIAHYDQYDHPVQKDLMKLLSEIYEYDLTKSPYGVDGCGIPTIAVPLQNINRGHINLTGRPGGKLILDALAKYPELISGENNFCTEITKVTKGRVFAKVGAEGVYCAFSPADNIFLSLKVHDGTARASQYAAASLLKNFGCIKADEEQLLKKFTAPKIKNWEGLEVGEYKLSF